MKKPAPIVLTNAEAQLVRAALASAIQNEEDFVACHCDRRTGRSWNPAVTTKAKRFITRMVRLKAKLAGRLRPHHHTKKAP